MPVRVTKEVKEDITVTSKFLNIGYMLGCDPEFFLKRKSDGKVIGSELLIDKKQGINSGRGKVIVDGVQVEINPSPSNCRASLGNSIVSCFAVLKQQMDIKGEFTADFSTTVELTKEELDKLHEDSRKFGCAPSLNAQTGKTSVIAVKGEDHMYRSAGGHIHIGTGKLTDEQVIRLTFMMDILVGIPCVLLDRDPGNIERRKIYGRASEYRLPPHGYEYRTLSNFWLRGYPLMSMVFGFTKVASWAGTFYDNTRAYSPQYNSKSFYDAIMATVDIKEVEDAINNNDFKLAYKIWNSVEPIWKEVVGSFDAETIGFNRDNIHKFHYLVWKGIDEFFPKDRDIVEYWSRHGDCHNGGIKDWASAGALGKSYTDNLKEFEEYSKKNESTI